MTDDDYHLVSNITRILAAIQLLRGVLVGFKGPIYQDELIETIQKLYRWHELLGEELHLDGDGRGNGRGNPEATSADE